jgi:hypothetical protein
LNLRKPDICNGLEHTTVYDNSKARLALMSSEIALNLKHKKRVMREEILPDLGKMINSSVNDRMKQIEEQLRYENEKARKKELDEIKKQNSAAKKDDFLKDVRKKLGEFNETLSELHVSSPPDTLNTDRNGRTYENVVIDIIGQKPLNSS